MEKNELLNEEMSNKEYLKKVKALKSAFMKDFARDAFIAYNDDFKNNTDLIANAARETNFDKQSLRSVYKRYNQYKKAFEDALSEKNIATNKQKYLDNAKKSIADLKSLKADVARAIIALKKGKMAIKKGSDKKYDQKLKDHARVAKYNKDQERRKPARARQDARDSYKQLKRDIKYSDKKRRQEFVKKVRNKVAKINFVTGK